MLELDDTGLVDRLLWRLRESRLEPNVSFKLREGGGGETLRMRSINENREYRKGVLEIHVEKWFGDFIDLLANTSTLPKLQKDEDLVCSCSVCSAWCNVMCIEFTFVRTATMLTHARTIEIFR